jgi:ABC-type antimicrobial peptide transport system permease subunit
MLWIQNELQQDKSNKNSNDMQLLCTKIWYGANQSWSTGSPPAVGPAMKEHFPEVINSCRLVNGTADYTAKYKDKLFNEEFQFADPSVFEIFTLPLIMGSYEKAKENQFTVILSEMKARKYFGDENPIGKSLLLDNKYNLEVIAVMKDIPENSTYWFDVFVPIEIVNTLWQENTLSTWYNCSFNTIVLLDEGVERKAFNEKIQTYIIDNSPEDEETKEPYLYPFSKIYLKMYGRFGVAVSIGIIAAMILLIACINYINISTARASRRAREVGIRKVIGGQRKSLIVQFLMESLLITFMAICLALILVELLLPLFNSITGKNLSFQVFHNPIILISIPLIWFITGILASIYPAIFMSGYKPLTILKQSNVGLGGKSTLRKILVTIQFVLSISFIIFTLFLYKQITFLRTKDLGYSSENIVYVKLEGDVAENPEILRRELYTIPGVQEISFLGRDPTSIWTNGSGWEWEGKPDDLDPFVTYQGVDHNYLNTFRIELAKGKFYTEETPGDRFVVINESFAKKMDVENPVGMTISTDDDGLQIIGVVKDFHYKSNHHTIGPLVLFHNNENDYSFLTFRYAYIRINSQNISHTIKEIETTVKNLEPDFPTHVRFLKADIERLYRNEVRFEKLIIAFTILAIFISCLGLFGLSTYLAQRRTREIGIRKVMGSSVFQIIKILSFDFLKWVLLANVIAWPLTYYYVVSWLQNYPYKIKIDLSIFLLSGFAAILISMITISINTLKASHSNPVDAIKYE